MMRLALLPVCFFFLLPTYAQVRTVLYTGDPGVLKDVGPIEVLVENLPSSFESFGLHRDDIQRDVELKLRLAGITIDDDEPDYLYVNVSGNCPSDGGVCGIRITVLYKEPVLVMRGGEYNEVRGATTWDAVGETGRIGSHDLQALRGYVKDMVDEFVNAYLTANPKL